MGWLKFLLKRKLIVGLMVVFILFIGTYATTKLDQELMPPITFDGAVIQVDAGSMTTLDIEERVTTPIEQTLLGIDGVESFQSSSSVGNSTITIEIEEGRGEEVASEVKSILNGLKAQLIGVNDIYVFPYSMNGTYEFFLDISNGDKEDMAAFAREVLEPRLEALPEVHDVDLVGIDQKEIIIELNQDKVDELGIDVQQMIGYIQQSNNENSLGLLTGEQNEPTVRWNTSIHNVNDVKNITIPTVDGIKKINEFALVSEQSSENSAGVWKNGSANFILVQVSRVSDVTQIEMAAAVRAEIEKIRADGFVEGFDLDEIVSQADYVTDAISGVSQNVLIGGILALVVLLLFLRNIRATLIIGIAIPLSILLTFTTMLYFDYSFNMLSLVGLGLGIGMMVDASIVILESIFKKKEQGLGSFEAVIKGTGEVSTAVLASMLTTIVVFLPIGLLGGEVGKFMIILSLVVVFTLVSSVLVSFTLIPTLAENFLKVSDKAKKRGEGKIIRQYGNLITWMSRKKRYRYSMITLFFIIFVGSLTLVSKVPMIIMPDVFNRYSEVMVQLESGTTPSEREEIALAIYDSLKGVPELTNTVVIDNVNSIYAIINMTPIEEATIEQSEINEQILSSIRTLEEKYPVTSVGSAMGMGGGFPISLEIKGDDFGELDQLSQNLINDLEQIDGLVGIKATGEKLLEEEEIVLKEKPIKDDNLTPVQISNLLQPLFMKSPIGEITADDNTTRSLFVTTDKQVERKQEALDYKVTTPMGDKEKLSKYIGFKNNTVPAQIDRKDGERYVTVIADLEGRDPGSVNRDIQQVLQDFQTPNGYSVSMSGDLEAQQEAMQEMLIILGIALFLVYVVMAVQFNSLKHPLIVMSIIPMTITGVILGLFITQMELSIMSAMGVVMLIGIVLNNAILLIDRTKQLRNADYQVAEAVIEAGKSRLRPIFMTTLTTVGGMLPLALATGVSSSYQSPLATVVISGLLFATMITLVLIPAVYLLFEDITRGLGRLKKRKITQVIVDKAGETKGSL
ncbi:efflux RND transporter permease subunit [Alkalihalobacterium elongatum]|uniref:efflux RND transporter permease subunit n=1 Tax=Alkalihalobacterium elongatum TaxID=2675466 RepID=UPI001C201533|nr:efflux RND transporter permease subunit [Alkalihalobacterium elongatum]